MKKINIIIGRFQPITKGHVKCMEYAYKDTGLPTILCMIETKESKLDSKHPFPSTLIEPLYNQILKGEKYFEKIVLVKNADIVKIGEVLKSQGYQIGAWTCGTDRYDSYKKMSDKYGEQAGLADDFKLIEIKRTDEDESATKLRQMLIDGDKEGFYTMSPNISLSNRMKLNYYEVLRDVIMQLS